ncbi:hypothetical protein B0H14DRAFT_3753357 [Mycena olivaceomarginata]|nr:hypothetical protein B0H14DRAFT_3753357 [Mycena olivaceomarginata]
MFLSDTRFGFWRTCPRLPAAVKRHRERVAHRDAAQCAISFAFAAALTSPPSPCDCCPHRALISRSGIAGSLGALVLSKSAATSSASPSHLVSASASASEQRRATSTARIPMSLSSAVSFTSSGSTSPSCTRCRCASCGRPRPCVPLGTGRGSGHIPIHTHGLAICTSTNPSTRRRWRRRVRRAGGRSPHCSRRARYSSPTTIIAPPYSFLFLPSSNSTLRLFASAQVTLSYRRITVCSLCLAYFRFPHFSFHPEK